VSDQGRGTAAESFSGTDEDLVVRCRRDRAALQGSFRALYERHAGRCLRFLQSLLGSEERAKDALQETFLRVYHQLDRYDADRPFGPWLLGIARHVAADALRREARRPATALPEVEPPAPTADGAPVPAEVSRREEVGFVREAVGALPDREREVFLLKHVEGLTFDEVAGAVGCSVRTAKYRMRAAVDALAVDLRARGVLEGA
jgi:RNA polymerase sigma-70 factor (ECF subfamily)